ncbi:hypothetical protein Tco_1061977 [Tanacetum coccineum]
MVRSLKRHPQRGPSDHTSQQKQCIYFPSNPDALIKFVNDLGYPKVVRHLSDVVTNDMFQPWRALTTITNLCLTRKTSGFETLRALVLQILWAYSGKKESHSYCDPEYKVHQADHPLLTKEAQVPHETKMPIPNDLVMDDIRGKQYYNAYLEKIAKHQRYLAGEDTTKSTPSQPPKLAPTKPQEKKRKRALDAVEAPSQAKRSKAGKDTYPAHRGPLPPVVFREPDSGKLQPLLEVQDAYSCHRKTFGLVESSSLYAELGLTNSRTESDKEVSPEMNAQGQEEGQGGTNPGDAGVSQTPSSHMQMDDEFTATAYPKVHKNLKLPTEGKVRLEEPASSAETLSSMKNLDKDLSFTNQFLDTSSVPLMTTPVIDITDPQSDSTTVLVSMPTTTAMTIGQLEQNIADLVNANQALEERLDKQGNMIHQLEIQDLSRLIREQIVEFIDSQEIDRKIKELVKEVVTASVQHAMRAPLHARFKDLPTSNMTEILLQRMLEENYDKGHEDHKMAYEALQKSIIRDESKKFDTNKAEERTKKKSKQDSPKTLPGSPPSPPPPPPPSGTSGASGTTGASDSAQDPPPPPPSSTTNRVDQSYSSAALGSSKIAASTAYTA